MDIGTFLRIWWCAELVGEDEFGNKYYEDKKPSQSGIKKRWVVYKGLAEASKIPADWHGWMHYKNSEPPEVKKKHYWERQHQPNLTGTAARYLPKGSIGKRTLAEELSYQPWVP
jgi:NADH:ubiquinone oxidoreductase subunit